MNTHAVVGNALDDTPAVKQGALCYVSSFSLATASVEVLVVNRDGAWISQWRPGQTLGKFRAKIVPKGHPAFGHALGSAAARARAATLATAFASSEVTDVDQEPDHQTTGTP